jgi:hypothetical protein
MSGQKSPRGRSLCGLYSLVRYATRRFASAMRALRCQRVRIYHGLCDILHEGAVWECSSVALYVTVKRVMAVTRVGVVGGMKLGSQCGGCELEGRLVLVIKF